MTHWGEAARTKEEAAALGEAEERLCKAPCRWYSTLRGSMVIACGPEGSTTYERKYELSVPACRWPIKPLTDAGEDCPYFEPGEGGSE